MASTVCSALCRVVSSHRPTCSVCSRSTACNPQNGADDHILDHDVESAEQEDIRHRQGSFVPEQQLAQRFGLGVRPHLDAPADHHLPDGVARYADAALEPLGEQPGDRRLPGR
jgi:hypothetical protein